jgi:hypothetical protein
VLRKLAFSDLAQQVSEFLLTTFSLDAISTIAPSRLYAAPSWTMMSISTGKVCSHTDGALFQAARSGFLGNRNFVRGWRAFETKRRASHRGSISDRMAGLLEEMEEMAGGASFSGGNFVTMSGPPPYGSSNGGIQLNPPLPPIPPSGVPQASLIDSINGQVFGSPRIFGSADPFFPGGGSPPMPPVPPTPPAGGAPPGSPPNMPMSYPGVMPMMPFAPGGAGIFGFSSGMPPAPPMFSIPGPEKVDGEKVVKVGDPRRIQVPRIIAKPGVYHKKLAEARGNFPSAS